MALALSRDIPAHVRPELVVTLPLFYEAEHVTYSDNITGSSSYASPETLNIGPTLEFNYATLSKK